MNDESSVIFLESKYHNSYICEDGYLSGNLIVSNIDNFVKDCKKWYQQHLKHFKFFND